MKTKLYLILLILALIALIALVLLPDYITERTIETSRQMIEDEIHTDWVKAAKECDTIASDTIKVWGDELR